MGGRGAGGGGGEHTFIYKNSGAPLFFPFLTGRIDTLIYD